MEIKQLDLFIKSNTNCACSGITHALTEIDYEYCLNKLEKIKHIIKNTGWDLSGIYYYYHDKINSDCNAWKTENIDYLLMKSSFRSKYEKAQINVKRNKYH